MESNSTSLFIDKVSQKQNNLAENLWDQKSKVKDFKDDLTEVRVDIKIMKNELKEIEDNSNKICDTIAEQKADLATTTEGTTNVSQTVTALKRKFDDLLGRINMTSGKLNVIEQWAKDLNLKTTTAQQNIPKQETKFLSVKEVQNLIDQYLTSKNTTRLTRNNDHGGGDNGSRNVLVE